MKEKVNPGFLKTVIETEKQFQTNTRTGMTEEAVTAARQEYGLNKMAESKRKSLIRLFIEQFKDFLILVLIVAAVVSGLVGEVSDAILILIIIVLNAVVGVAQESRAADAMEALNNMVIPEAKVIRNSERTIISSVDLVPGDIVLLDAGDSVPADGRLFDAARLQIQEAALTGESVPVEKKLIDITDPDTPLGDRVNFVYSGSVCTYGRGAFIVTDTGMDTEIGKIAGMLQNTKNIQTPLQKSLEHLGKVMGIGCLAICALMFGIGLWRGGDPMLLFMTAVSLAVAAIPEGLAAIVTVVLAMGMQKLAKMNAIVRKLPAVETLGCASVICSDKTGTLTQNRMTVRKIYANEGIIDAEDILDDGFTESEKFVVRIGQMCNDASITYNGEETIEIGDPTEVALKAYANLLHFGENHHNLVNAPRVGELPFDSDRKLMTTLHHYGSSWVSYTKGAPDVILSRCTHYLKGYELLPLTENAKAEILAANETLSDGAYRVLGYAYKFYLRRAPKVDMATLEHGMTFVGLTGMIDPPRDEVRDAIGECHAAGIHTVMITGDHKNTAVAIAKDLNLYQADSIALSGVELDALSDAELDEKIEHAAVYARVSPENKVRIVEAWQRKGAVVAMTGDGVNDAPALKKANIGCAMGITGTDVSKQSADMILADDNFTTIVAAVREGRSIYENIKKAVHFLLSCNIAEILITFLATLVGMVQPLLPVHILWINLITDSMPALALAFEKNDDEIMTVPPRHQDESIFAHGLGAQIIYQGIVLAALSIATFYYGYRHFGIDVARTMVFAQLGLSQLAHVLNVRSERKSVFGKHLTSNRYLWGAIAISMALQLVVILVPGLRGLFSVTALTGYQWLIVVLHSLAPLVVVEGIKRIK